ncbi:MAG: YmdB family metallophosphoesterase [Deltaproteobacteria bacterium]|jgi:metallophosphoesterase (TIGR00282 family)|nr:YmdB family metallophosphoesterase [Deltaproteobacteria bacterium]
MTRILFLGDVFSKTGRNLAKTILPGLMGQEGIDLALANGENAAGGVGLTARCARDLLSSGISAISGGNHTFKYEEINEALDEAGSVVIRPANYPEPCPGRGFTVVEARDGARVGFGNLMGRLFMNPAMDCPFRRAESLIDEMKAAGADLTVIDFHAEATSEKMSLAHHLDGRLGALLGTHTHVQTSDAQILPGGLAYVTDVGMTGPHLSVIGMRPEEPIAAFLTGRNHRFKPSTDGAALEAVIVDFDDDGLAMGIRAIRVIGAFDIGGEP